MKATSTKNFNALVGMGGRSRLVRGVRLATELSACTKQIGFDPVPYREERVRRVAGDRDEPTRATQGVLCDQRVGLCFKGVPDGLVNPDHVCFPVNLAVCVPNNLQAARGVLTAATD